MYLPDWSIFFGTKELIDCPYAELVIKSIISIFFVKIMVFFIIQIVHNGCVVAVAGFRALQYPTRSNPHAIINIIKKCGILMVVVSTSSHQPAIATTQCCATAFLFSYYF